MLHCVDICLHAFQLAYGPSDLATCLENYPSHMTYSLRIEEVRTNDLAGGKGRSEAKSISFVQL